MAPVLTQTQLPDAREIRRNSVTNHHYPSNVLAVLGQMS